jgi:hypothetical protein
MKISEPMATYGLSPSRRKIGEAPPEDEVELPWDRRGHSRTGLKEGCAAVCIWMAKVGVERAWQ